ncbi:MAG: hypothetical protein MPK62_08140 [Alphaproteobacteria bacterium]|nr:hypothetical protein [Alphaproteobacteria bacterium]
MASSPAPRSNATSSAGKVRRPLVQPVTAGFMLETANSTYSTSVSYTHPTASETNAPPVCRLLLAKTHPTTNSTHPTHSINNHNY